jgi:hypothetical protein
MAHRKTPFVYYLALWGCISTGIIYTAVGIIALLSFLKLKQGGADEGSFLVFLNQYIAGKVLIWIIMLGMVSYVIWRIYEVVRDPYGYGRDLKGRLKRTGIALSSFADVLIAWSAVGALLGSEEADKTGVPTAQRELAARMLDESWGKWALLVIGVLTCLTAIIQLWYLVSKAYRERLDIDHLALWRKRVIYVLAWAGHSARGIILGIMGFFLIKAFVTRNPEAVVNTDKAFDFLGDDVSHFSFIIVAIATICYGLFMFVFGAYYDTDKD